MTSKPDNSDLTNAQWAHLAITSFRDGVDKFMAIALDLPKDKSDSAFEYAEVLDNTAYQIERIMNRGGKRANKDVSKIRKLYSDDILGAIDGFYRFLCGE